jgi:hypothetical protein
LNRKAYAAWAAHAEIPGHRRRFLLDVCLRERQRSLWRRST